MSSVPQSDNREAEVSAVVDALFAELSGGAAGEAGVPEAVGAIPWLKLLAFVRENKDDMVALFELAKKLYQKVQVLFVAEGTVGAEAGMDPATIIMLISTLAPVLKQLLEKWLAK